MKIFSVFVISMLAVAFGIICLLNVNLSTTNMNSNNYQLVDMIGRQRELIQRYVKEVLVQQDTTHTKKLLLKSNHALMYGTTIVTRHKVSNNTRVSKPPTEEIQSLLATHKNEILELFRTGDDLPNPLLDNHYKQKRNELLSLSDKAFITAENLNQLYTSYLHNNTKRISAMQLIITTLFLLAGFFCIIFLARSKQVLSKEVVIKGEIEKKLKIKNKELEQFAYIASHDLQEPLRIITSYLQILEKRLKNKLEKDEQEFISYAIDGAQRLRGLINNLLELSRIDTRGSQFTSIDCNEVIELIKIDLADKIQKSNATIQYQNLPTIYADKHQIHQLLQNIIDNAIKYCKNNKPSINIIAEKKNNKWLFSVTDNGIGIPKKQLSRIFQIFQRLHTREEYEGTGIGLAICKKIVARHNGNIWVESELGKGSTFFFTLPL